MPKNWEHQIRVTGFLASVKGNKVEILTLGKGGTKGEACSRRSVETGNGDLGVE
jgi:hypothetical protein